MFRFKQLFSHRKSATPISRPVHSTIHVNTSPTSSSENRMTQAPPKDNTTVPGHDDLASGLDRTRMPFDATRWNENDAKALANQPCTFMSVPSIHPVHNMPCCETCVTSTIWQMMTAESRWAPVYTRNRWNTREGDDEFDRLDEAIHRKKVECLRRSRQVLALRNAKHP
jgi:hypothetical protein